MKAFAIVLEDHPISIHGFNILVKSSKDVKNDFEIKQFNAFDCISAHEFMCNPNNKLRWTWPWEGEKLDFSSGLKMRAYQTKIPLARIGCFLSHFHLWKKAVELEENILILEHDAIFVKKFIQPDVMRPDIGVSINDPRGATRKATIFHNKLQSMVDQMEQCPWVDDDRSIPQGFPGNSAYVIGPELAQEAIDFTLNYGAWPNDALLCKQNFPGKLWSTKEYFTTIQGLRSTTST